MKNGIRETETHGYLEFENVTFAYPGETENPVLHNISFTAKPGETIAFIGSTGSGEVFIGSVDSTFLWCYLRENQGWWSWCAGIPTQVLSSKDWFYSSKSFALYWNVAENLRYGKEDASREELNQAADVAQAKDFIESREEGFGTHLAEGGSNLSGGQKQRLSIARAVIKEPDIYIFDDSFSALDYRTDAILRRRLKEVTQNATVLIVAQRVGTIMDADQIIVLDKGEIVGRGRHEELMATKWHL